MTSSGAIDPSSQIAIIGMSGRFPGSRDLAEYWQNLCDGVESVVVFTDQELTAAGVDAASLSDPNYVKAGIVLEGVDQFDAPLFGFTPREAEVTDPQQRLFLECAYEALEEAGYDPDRFEGAIGVYAGTGINTYWLNLLDNRELMAAVGVRPVALGNDKDYLATLVSYKMNLRGPSVTVQTACSTSLVAVHLASQSVLNGECDIALAGGSRVRVPQRQGYYYFEGGIESPDGHCRAFDAGANGCIFGSGAGVVVLKRLSDALADGDTIHAVIRGSAINNDGAARIGFAAPSVQGQAQVIAEALAVAGVGPDEITYVEAHGTGTRLGDPIEIAALTQAFQAATERKGFCAIGSVKTNIGHLDAAAGVAGLIKTALALKHRAIPPSLNFTRPNPLLGLENSPFYVNTSLRPWHTNGVTRRAAVSSFGIGGTNSHVVLEEAPAAESGPSSRNLHLLVVSARTVNALDRATDRLRAFLKQNPALPLADIAFTLQLGRRVFRERRCLVCSNVEEAMRGLEARDSRQLVSGRASESARDVVFMFSGQGTQTVGMGRELYDAEPCFREWIDSCAEMLQGPLGVDLRELLYPMAGQEAAAEMALEQTRYAQPALFVVEYALAQWLMKCGLKPVALIGHSLGEYVAACLAGVFKLADGLRLVVRRGDLMQQTQAGAMLAIQLEDEKVLGRLGPGLSLAAINGGGQCVVSGAPAAVAELEADLEVQGISCRRLRTAVAFHSESMDPIIEPYHRALQTVQLRPPVLPYISNVTGDWIRPADACDRRYWLRHVREAVLFGAGVRVLAQDRQRAMLEVGPGETLCRLARREAPDSLVLATLGSSSDAANYKGEANGLFRALGKLWVSGVELEWQGLYEREKRRRVGLPTYPFERERCWVERQEPVHSERPRKGSAVISKRDEIADWFYVPVWRQTPLPWLSPREEAGACADECLTWLVLAGEDRISLSIVRRLEERGRPVIIVEAGSDFAVTGDARYQVNPGSRSDYAELLRTLEARDQFPHRILHLWSLETGERAQEVEEAFDRTQKLGFYSLLYLAQALGGRPLSARSMDRSGLRIDVVTERMQGVTGEERLQAEHATVLGPCKVIPQEHGYLTCRSIDIAKPDTTWQETQLVELVIEEISSPACEPVVAYRGGRRWVQAFEPVRPVNADRAPRLRVGGVYLITGGLGRIGTEIAAYLSREFRAKLALLGRRSLPPRDQWERVLQAGDCPRCVRQTLERFLEMEQNGGEVLAESVDVTDEAAIKEVVARVKARWGVLNGVIHGAGLLGAESLRLVAEADWPDCEAQFRPKVIGARLLERALEGEQLDFCLLMSSVSAMLGGLGFAAYAAANQFLDAFAHEHNGKSGQRWTSVNWESWNFAGHESEPLRGVGSGIARLALSPREGVEAFVRLLELGEITQVIVSCGDLAARIRQWSNPGGRREQVADQSASEDIARAERRAPLSINEFEIGRDRLEDEVARIWEEILGIDPIGVRDNFFELGGHSLLATQVVSRVRGKLGVEMPLRSLFEEPTVRGMAEVIRKQTGAQNLVASDRAIRVRSPGDIPLSFAQQRLWFIHRLEPDSPAYNIPLAIRIRGALDVSALTQSLAEIARRHEVLRTRFEERGGLVTQIIEEAKRIELPMWDLRQVVAEDREALGLKMALMESERPFDLGRGPVWRAAMVRVGDEDHMLLLNMHHVASDGWSVGVLVEEFCVLYEGYRGGLRPALAKPPVQYADFAIWQRERLLGEELEKQMGYWRSRLDDLSVLELPTDIVRGKERQHRSGREAVGLGSDLTRGLNELSRREGVTLFMTLLAGFQILLARYAAQEDVAVGTDVANRNRVETEGLIGFFVNQLVLRTDLSGNPSIGEALERVRETTLGAYAHQDLPFEKLVEELDPERDLSRSPLFQVKLVFQNAPQGELRVGGVDLEPFAIDLGVAKLDLTMSITEAGDSVRGTVEYARDLYLPSSIERLLRHLQSVFEAMVIDAEQRIGDVSLLTVSERQRLLTEWDKTEHGGQEHLPMHRLFESEAALSPETVAVVGDDASLSYGELNERANRLAHYLIALGVGPDIRVALCAERGLEMVVGVLAVLKAGGAYVPMDPRYPTERLQFMIDDARASALLTQARLRGRLPSSWTQVIELDRDWELIAGYPATNPRIEVPEDSIAYQMYTSGSTGRPKGVMVTHRGLANYAAWAAEVYEVRQCSSSVVQSSIAFDLTVTGLLVPLISGARVALVGDVEGVGAVQAGVTAGDGDSLIKLTPSQLEVVEGLLPEDRASGYGGVLVIGGEALTWEQLAYWRKNAPGKRIINEYGPTETVVGCCFHDAAAQEKSSGPVPVGLPIANTRAYAVDKFGQLIPEGIAGELYVGGAGVARGYWNEPALTAERFVPDWLGCDEGGRLYRTGDLVRWRGSGRLEYVRRADDQVKVRGYRVEPKEIETVLGEHGGVKQCAVTQREDEASGGRLVAYIVWTGKPGGSRNELREFLERRLPEYMWPVAFVEMPELPLTANGKLDRRALPAPSPGAPLKGEGAVSRTPIEEIVAGIWSHVLNLEQVGVRENFFELGGHSLLATQVVSRIRDALGVEVPLRVLFERPTVGGLAAEAEKERALGRCREAAPMTRVGRDSELPLSFAQQRLWFIHQLEPDSAAYNVPRAIRIRGLLDLTSLNQSLREIARRHEVLRTRFEEREGRAVQVIGERVEVEVPVWDLSGLKDEERERLGLDIARIDSERPFDLERGPVWRASVARMGQEDYMMLLNMHHVASDGWSVGVLVKEFSVLYEGCRGGQVTELADPLVQYADFAVWQREWLQGEELEKQMGYWRSRLDDLSVLELPTERGRSRDSRQRSGREAVGLATDLTRGLNELSRREGVTLFMTLLAGFQIVLARYAGQEDVVVGTDVANRNRVETEGLIGFFVNQLVLRTDLSGNPSIREALERVRETTLGAYAHQDLPFERLVEELDPERDLSRSPLFQVKLVMQNAGADTPAQISGLRLEGVELKTDSMKLALHLMLRETEGGVRGSLRYATDLFDSATARRLVEALGAVLRAAAKDARKPIAEIDLLTEAERQQLLIEWNETNRDYGPFRPVHELFEQQAERLRDSIAVVFEDEELSYGRLNEGANRVAASLHRLGVEADVRVAVCMERGIDLLIGIMGTLKAGAAYVPLDLSNPSERLSRMIEDSQAAVVLTQDRVRASLPATWAMVFSVDAENPEWIKESGANPRIRVEESSLAYVIYTSGSTGRPKGVGIEHRQLVNYVNAIAERLDLEPGWRMGFISTIGADLGHTTLYPSLCFGGELHVISEETGRDSRRWEGYQRERRIECLKITPTHVEGLVESEEGLPTRILVLGGEASRRGWVAWARDESTCEVVNHYGPTETTVGAVTHRVESEEEGDVPIGKPLGNVRSYVLDRRGGAVPLRARGELFLGGGGIGRGYLNDGAQTAERFVPDGISGRVGERLYRTGDVVRWKRNGALELIGRVDEQVKVRGHRVEPGEIEKVLAEHARVKQCAVLARETDEGESRLVAYIVASEGGAPAAQELKEYLARKLPEYMLPGAFMELAELPLTRNGKLDRKALPLPDRSLEELEREGPRTPVEEIVAGIWEEVLRVEQVGRSENFFELGGHSLLATQVISRVRDALGVEVPLRVLFEDPTVAGLANEVEKERGTGVQLDVRSIRPVSRERDLPLSYAQQRLWFLDRLEPDRVIYNIARAVRIKGLLDISAVLQSLNEIMRRHEVLRTRFDGREDGPVQLIEEAPGMTLTIWDVGSLPEAERDGMARLLSEIDGCRPFNLEYGPLWKASLMRSDADDHLLLLTLHHVVSDGWSVATLVMEFSELYEAYRRGAVSPLAELRVQYADFAVWQREELTGYAADQQLRYWVDRLKGAPERLELPYDSRCPRLQGATGNVHRFNIGEELTGRLRALCRAEGVTFFMLILGAWQVLLYRYSGQEDICVGTPIANRNRAETERLVGFFVNTLVMRANLGGNPTFRDVLGRVRNAALEAHENQDVPFERIVEELQPERSLHRTPLFNVWFNLGNTPVSNLKLGELMLQEVEVRLGTSKFDLALLGGETGSGLGMTLEYNSDLFSAEKVAGIAHHLETLLDHVAHSPLTRILDIRLAAEDHDEHDAMIRDQAAYPTTGEGAFQFE